MLDKLSAINDRYNEVERLISSPEAMSDMKNFVQLSKEYKDLEPIIKAYKEYRDLVDNIAEAKAIISTTDDLEMKAVEKHIPFDSIPRLGSIAGVDLYLICHDRGKTLSLQNQMIQDIEERKIDKKQIECSEQKIIGFKKKIPLLML